MTELLTAAQMRAIEQAAIASGEVTGLDLMERAGRGVVEAIFEEWPALRATSHRAVVLCGPGNNGGDGFVVARLLKEWGWEVTVHHMVPTGAAVPDAEANRLRFVAIGGTVFDLPRPITPEALRAVAGLDRGAKGATRYLVDAMFGTGLSRSIDSIETNLCQLLYEMGDALAEAGVEFRCVAVDVPSGLCSDSGRILTVPGRSDEMPVISADLTVTFHALRRGHLLAEGPGLCGTVRIVDIGIDATDTDLETTVVGAPRAGAIAKWSGHKYSHGHALILAGPPGHGGAARMTARGALRIGAGLVTVACPPEALPENAGRLDAIMLKVVADGAGLAEVLADTRINALCLGPGLGLDARAAELVKAALVGRGSPRLSLTLDADALTLISRDPTLFALLHGNCVLTPHGGEFARLFPDIAALLDAPATTGPAYSKVDATRDAAARAGCTVLYKGPDTVIASPDGTCAVSSAVYDRAAPWLATAGSGDVLAGFITGLLARGFLPQQAAETAAWLHVECARSFGPGLIAEDLPEELPKVFRSLGL